MGELSTQGCFGLAYSDTNAVARVFLLDAVRVDLRRARPLPADRSSRSVRTPRSDRLAALECARDRPLSVPAIRPDVVSAVLRRPPALGNAEAEFERSRTRVRFDRRPAAGQRRQLGPGSHDSR